MRYLVTGGAGFIGSHLVEDLVKRDEQVVVLDNFATGRRSNLEPFLKNIDLIEASVTDLEACREACKGVDFVLHQAALPSVARSVSHPFSSHEVNATGTLNILTAARDGGIGRFVFAASSSAYGNTVELPKREDMPSRPMSPYAVSKLAGEGYCRAFHASYGLETIMLRYFNVFGPRQDPTSQYGAAVPKFISAALMNEAPTIFGDGEQTRDFTFVANIVSANMLACRAPASASGKVYNIGCGERISINLMWERIRDITGATVQARYEPARRSDVRDSLASLEKSSRLLSYEPTVQLDEGLRRTVEHFAALSTAGDEGLGR